MGTKNKFFQMRMTAKEYRNLKLIAHREGVSMSELIRVWIRTESEKRGMPT